MLHRLRLSAPSLRVQAWLKAARRRVRLRHAPKVHGHCPVCEADATFALHVDNPREGLLCLACGSVPRQRALIAHLRALALPLANARVHESSPSLCTWQFFRRNCPRFTASYFLPEVAAGARVGAFLCVDLEHQPFADGSFDLVVTQDVFEHVPEPMLALREIQRTLSPDGVHVFTVPRANWRTTQPRAVRRNGQLELLAPAEFHRDPIARRGTLVVTDWGHDLERLVAEQAGVACSAQRVGDPAVGGSDGFEVFVAKRPR